jgi:transposase
MPATGSLKLIEAIAERFDCAQIGERRRWSEACKERAVATALEPGVNVSALARSLGISPPQPFGWRKALLNKQKRVSVSDSAVPLVEIVLRGIIVRVSPDVDEAALLRILRAVRSA